MGFIKNTIIFGVGAGFMYMFLKDRYEDKSFDWNVCPEPTECEPCLSDEELQQELNDCQFEKGLCGAFMYLAEPLIEFFPYDIDIYLVDPITGFMADEVIPGKPYEANFNVLSGFVGNYKLIINYNGEQETLLSDTGSFTHEFVTGDIPSEMHFDLYKEGIHYGKIRIWIPVIT